MAIIGSLTINGEGRPRVEGRILDFSQIRKGVNPARVCVLGVTLLGTPYVPKAIDTWAQFVQEFGGIHPNSDFPLMCKRALDAGAKLYVARVAHWATTAWEGTKATATVTQSLNSVTFTAKEVGAGYNGITIQIKAARSRNTTKVDVVETYNGLSTTIYDINLTSPAASDMVKLNNGLKYTSVSAFPATMPIGTATLANGAQTFASIVDSDYVGSFSTETKGLTCFDTIYDSMRIANLDRPTPTVDAAFIAYCEGRKDMRAILQVPLADARDYDTMVDYRQGTGAYSHTAFDTIFADLTAGNIYIVDSSKVGGKAEIRSIGDIVALASNKDRNVSYGATTAGPNRGIIKNNLGMVYNLDEYSRAGDYDFVYDNQVNPVVETPLLDTNQVPVLQTVYMGNRSLYKNQNTLLRYSNVCDTIVYLRWKILPIMKMFLDEPNVPTTWFKIYARVKPVIEEAVALGLILAGEDINWQWRGDQNAKSLDFLQVNTKPDVSAGIYKAQFIFSPVTVMEYIGLDLVNADNETVVTIIENN